MQKQGIENAEARELETQSSSHPGKDASDFLKQAI